MIEGLRERIARAIEAEAEKVQSEGRYWGGEYAQKDEMKADAMRRAARIARETPDNVSDEEAQALAREMREAFPDDGKGEIRY